MTNLPPVIKIVPMPGIQGVKGDTGLVGPAGPQGPAGNGGGVSSTVPFELNDTNDDLLLSITKTGTGTTRIESIQDDLSLRSARDITLYPGSDGPGNVYIGWGDAVYTPDSPNRVATMGDINSAPKTYTADNDATYGTYQANGFVEVTSNVSDSLNTQVYSLGGHSNVTSILVIVDQTTNDLLSSIISGVTYLRTISIYDANNSTRTLRNPTTEGPTEGGWVWRFDCDQALVLNDQSNYALYIQYDGAPIVWWDADDINPTAGTFADANLRGAKIEYQAYISDAGTVIGTIYIACDSADMNVTHIETSSGGSDTGTAVFWRRADIWSDERKLYLFRTDGESQLHKIQWTAQMYYATEYYGD